MGFFNPSSILSRGARDLSKYINDTLCTYIGAAAPSAIVSCEWTAARGTHRAVINRDAPLTNVKRETVARPAAIIDRAVRKVSSRPVNYFFLSRCRFSPGNIAVGGTGGIFSPFSPKTRTVLARALAQ